MLKTIPKEDEIHPAVQQAESQAKDAIDIINVMTIDSKGEADDAVDFAHEMKEKYKELDSYRHSIIDPLQEATKRVNDLFRPSLKSLETGEKLIKQKVAEFLSRAETERRKALADAAEAYKAGDRAKGAELMSAAETRTVEKVQGAQIRANYSVNVTDKAALVAFAIENDLLDLIKIDEPKLKKLVKEVDNLSLPGVEVKYNPTVALKR